MKFSTITSAWLLLSVSILASAPAFAQTPAQAQAPEAAPEPFLSWFNPPQTPQPFLQHHSYPSAKMQTKVGYSIYLPPAYQANKTRRFPVVYWLHGLGGNEVRGPFSPRIVDEAVRSGKIDPLIVVYINGGHRSWYVDSPDGRWLAETTIIQELIPHIDATWRTRANRDGRAIQGFSMGGGGALKYAWRYPELFGSVVSFAGSFRRVEDVESDPGRAEGYARMFGANRDYYVAEHPFTLLDKNLPKIGGKMGIKLIVGSLDRPLLLETNATLRQMLEERRVPHEYQIVEGVGHDLTGLANAVGSDALLLAQQHFKTP